MKSRRFLHFSVYLLVALSMWSPSAESDYASVLGPLRYALFLLASLGIILHAYLARRVLVSLAPDWLFLIAFLVYTSLSVLWADASVNAYIKSLFIVLTLLAVISIANAQGLNETLRIIYRCFCVFVVLSLLTVIFLPSIGVETGWELEGDWRGISAQKNGLGAVAAFMLVAALALPLRRSPEKPPAGGAIFARAAMLGVAALCLVNSGSRGALLSAGIGVGSLLIAQAPKTFQRVTLIVLVLFAIPLVQLVISTVELSADKIGVLGTTIDTNSRTTLWSYGLEQLGGREFLGFGLAGFWTPERVTAFSDLNGWVLDNFHNGYITILVEGGVVGLALLLLSLAFIMLLFLVSIGNLKDPYLGLAFGYTNMFLVANLVENEIGRSTSLTFIMFLVISFSLRPYVLAPLGSRPAGVGAGGRTAWRGRPQPVG